MTEIPSFWLEKGNPWELERAEIMYTIGMGGESYKNHQTKEFEWHHEDTIQAAAYDIPITGFNTFNTNNLRLWRSRPYFNDSITDDGETPADFDSENEEDLETRIDKL